MKASAGKRLERLERYLSDVPGGLDAHPRTLAKGSCVRSVLEGQPVGELLPRLPPPLRRLAAEPPIGSEWVPEAHLAALLLAVADLRGMSDPDLYAWVRERNRALFRSPLYEILMAVASPASMLRFAGQRWANWHRGTELQILGVADDGVRATLRFPDRIFDGVMLRAFAEAFAAALEMARAGAPAVLVAEEGPTSATYVARW